ncbi:hypothetical protein [Pseudomonas viridiflava]|uniref:hypothetical protein n=1 Tax=Pseudomonas viridiflava TaxID=33069 RepID=UPI0013CEFB3C|nr:hypothetical protein [Pseudomonas viridiflava]
MALSRSKHRTVGGGLPAMNDTRFSWLTASTASPTSRLPQKAGVSSVAYRVLDKSGLAEAQKAAAQ